MNPEFSKSMRASITGRARFIEDLVEEQAKLGVDQYIILGAGLDTFAQRRPELSSMMQIFEVDQPGPQEWKKKRLSELNFKNPSGLHFVPVDFEAGESWWEKLRTAGFSEKKPAVVVSTGVSMYLTRETNQSTLGQLATLAPGSTFAMTFMLSLELLPEHERSIMEFVMKKAEASGTPFLSLFHPEDIQKMARVAGFKKARYVSAGDLYQKYFATRTDGLNAGSAEAFLVGST
jgi:methyltransferase (TIGR00027 family)